MEEATVDVDRAVAKLKDSNNTIMESRRILGGEVGSQASKVELHSQKQLEDPEHSTRYSTHSSTGAITTQENSKKLNCSAHTDASEDIENPQHYPKFDLAKAKNEATYASDDSFSMSTYNTSPTAQQKNNDLCRGEYGIGPTVDNEEHNDKLIKAEGRKIGRVSLHAYVTLLSNFGWAIALLVSAGMVGGQVLFLFSEYWVARWANSEDQGQPRWIKTYSGLVAGVVVAGLGRSMLYFHFMVIANTKMHMQMTAAVLRAPLQFFHANPLGRVLNRFALDQGMLDNNLPWIMFDGTQVLTQVIGALVLVSIARVEILAIIIPLFVVFVWIRGWYLNTSREVRRLEATTRSPVFSMFSALIKGLSTIRCYGVEDDYTTEFQRLLTLNGSWQLVFHCVTRWLGARLDFIVAVTISALAALTVLVRDRVEPSVVAVALAQVVQLMASVQYCVRLTAEIEDNMTAMERVLEYCELDQEPARLVDGAPDAPPGWPRKGSVMYKGLTARYRPGLPAVLHSLTFHIPGGSSIGIVGRTGSGKSSLLLTLFRLIEISDGSIEIDGVDITSIALDKLRSSIAIIPQDPVLFSGTLRSNLDPFGRMDDARLNQVLEEVMLSSAVRELGGLYAGMSEAGENLSVGQRQLFALARALLQDARILALDEATANVDGETDHLIQASLKKITAAARTHKKQSETFLEHAQVTDLVQQRSHEQPGDVCVGTEDDGQNSMAGKLMDGDGPLAGFRTLIVVAHRLHTIMDSDEVLVLDYGKLVEKGPPAVLQRQGGVFSALVAATATSGYHTRSTL